MKRPALLPLLSILAACAALLLGAPAEASAERDFQRGVVISCPRAGQIWGSPAMAESLGELDGLGVEWVAIHPYGWVKRDGTVRRYRPGEHGYLERAAALAKEAGMRLFWKPHLGYWGSFEWRGAIEFGADEAAWRRFFDGYRRFIVEQARVAERLEVPLFAIGVELGGTVHREEEWRGLIAAVRAVYDGRIVYAANWDRVDAVPFWDAIDRIGVHAYFPLASDDEPSRAELRAAWDGPLARLETLARRHDRPVLVAEIGYNRSPRAAAEPWDYETVDAPETRSLRARLMEVAIERLEAAPHVIGMYWWKWMPGTPNDPGDENFSLRDPEAREVLRRRWGRGTVDPSTARSPERGPAG